MNALQQTIHLVATDEDFRAALQADSEAALTQQGLALSPEERDILSDLRAGLVLSARTLADRFQGWYLSSRRRWE